MNSEIESKPKVAIISLTSCEGCEFAILDLGEKFFSLAEQVELVDFRLIEDEEDLETELDLIFVEGNPLTKANEETLLNARKRAKILVALGNCAAMGGVPEMRNYQEGVDTAGAVYRYLKGVKPIPVKEISDFVKVDFVLRGCPINGEEFLKYFPQLAAGKIPVLANEPVCVECRKKGNRCFLLDKKPCFGAMIQGGCGAPCPSAGMMCQGCRGLLPSADVDAVKKTILKFMTENEFNSAAEIFGLRDEIEKRLKK